MLVWCLQCCLPSKSNSSSHPLQGDQGDQGPRVCCSPPLLEIVGKKRLQMHEIPGIVFARTSQTQQELHCCCIKMRKENVQEVFLLICKSSYLLGLCQTGSCSISIISSDSLQPSTWRRTVRAFNHFQPCGLTSAASKWWWCECLSVPDRLRNELLSPISTLQLTHPSFFSNNVVKNEPVFDENNTRSNREGLFKKKGHQRTCFWLPRLNGGGVRGNGRESHGKCL